MINFLVFLIIIWSNERSELIIFNFEIFQKNVKKINIKAKFENIEILKNIKNHEEK